MKVFIAFVVFGFMSHSTAEIIWRQNLGNTRYIRKTGEALSEICVPGGLAAMPFSILLTIVQ